MERRVVLLRMKERGCDVMGRVDRWREGEDKFLASCGRPVACIQYTMNDPYIHVYTYNNETNSRTMKR